MLGRIGTLDVRYVTEGTDPLIAARLPGLTRALERDLADALDLDWSDILGGSDEVVVVRELHASMALEASALALDRPVVEAVSRAYGDALSERLAKPDEEVARFEDQAEFVAAFIVDELQGRAANLWYYGAFRRLRSADRRSTIEAVLTAHPREVASVLARLARRGYLESLLSLVGARRVLDLSVADAEVSHDRDLFVLIDAALDIVAGLGWSCEREARAIVRHALTIEFGRVRPDWTDRRRMTEFVWDVVERAASMFEVRGAVRSRYDREAVEALLRGRLDWLDAEWLVAAVERFGHDDEVGGSVRAGDPVAAVVEHVVVALRDGRLTVRPTDDIALTVIHLLAAADLGVADAPLVPRLRRLIERAVGDWRRLRAGDGGEATSRIAPLVRDDGQAARGPGAATAERALAHALVESTSPAESVGEATAGAGLYLVIRAVLDTGLPGLAKRHDVPLAPLLAGIARALLDVDVFTDGPALAWTGADSVDEADVARLEGMATNLEALEISLRDRIHTQGVGTLRAEVADELAVQESDHSVQASCYRIGQLVLRAWARWLRGLESSSPSFIVDRCLRRGGRVCRSAASIAVVLEPAPFDVVLDMAGYFTSIEAVPWLGGRSVTFSVARRFAA